MRIPILLLALLLSFVSTTSAQARFVGNVLEVTDGRTMVVETNAGRITARLQYIESPEPEQALYSTVKDHLSNLAVGRNVEFVPLRIVGRVTVGRATVGGVDLSLQLIRDGAAWHEPAETSGQPADAAAEYAGYQDLAKSEKRGVWSVAGMKAPWEIRAERQAALDRADRERRASRPTVVGVNQFQSENRSGPDPRFNVARNPDRQLGLWASLFTGRKNETYGLHTVAEPNGRFTAVYSSPSFVQFNGGKESFKVEIRIAYVIAKVYHPLGNEWYALYVRSMKDSYKFEKRRNSLTIAVDGKKLSAGTPYIGAKSDTDFGNHEFFFYKLSRAHVAAIANSKDSRLIVDGLKGELDADARGLFKQIADSMK